MKTLIFLLIPLFTFGQVQDSTDVAIDTSGAVIMANKIKVAKVAGDEGMIIFETTVKKHQGWDGSAWFDLY